MFLWYSCFFLSVLASPLIIFYHFLHQFDLVVFYLFKSQIISFSLFPLFCSSFVSFASFLYLFLNQFVLVVSLLLNFSWAPNYFSFVCSSFLSFPWLEHFVLVVSLLLHLHFALQITFVSIELITSVPFPSFLSLFYLFLTQFVLVVFLVLRLHLNPKFPSKLFEIHLCMNSNH